MNKKHKQETNTESSNVLYNLLDIVFDNKMMQNEQEVKHIDNELFERAQKILNEFGPEGAYKMSEFLRIIADEDIKQGMQM